MFLSKGCLNSYKGYALGQMRKAKGLNKKMHYPENMERKDVLDFCYILLEKESSVKFKHWATSVYDKNMVKPNEPWEVANSTHGLAKVNNAPDIYSIYYMPTSGGIVKENSNDVQLRSIPIDAPFRGYLRFDRDAYSTHCKDYKEWSDWKKKRNPERHRVNKEVGQDYDPKNMAHCIRLLNMVIDIGKGKGVVVRRPEAKELLEIKHGKYSFSELEQMVKEKIDKAEELFKSSDLPQHIDRAAVSDVLEEARHKFYMYYDKH